VSPTDEHPSFAPDSSAGRKKTSAASSEQQAAAPLLSINVDPGSGRVVSIESMDASGDRRQLSDEERSRLSELKPDSTLRDIVERAFEAGVDCVLGQQVQGEEIPESEEDAELSRMLLRSLIAESAAKRLTQFDVLSPAIVGTLIERAASRDPFTDASAAH